MRNPDRIDGILNNIKEVWKEIPDLRLMQLLLNVSEDCYIEDEAFMRKFNDFYKLVEKYSVNEEER